MAIPYQVAYVVFFGLGVLVGSRAFGNDAINAERFTQIVRVEALGIAVTEAVRAAREEP